MTLWGRLGRSVALIPIFRTVYSTVRQISHSFSNTETSYDSLVLVEFPREGLSSIELVTSQSPREIAGTTAYNVFLPTSPNPAGVSFSSPRTSFTRSTSRCVREWDCS